MSGERTCRDGGYLGPPRVPIPDDPRVYLKSEQDLIGCNRIWCRDCESWVRHRNDTQLAWAPSTRADERWLYEHVAELAPPKIREASGYRLYACRCANYTAVVPKNAPSFDEATWRCAGHPEEDVPDAG